MSSLRLARLQEERKDHPFGFHAKPTKNPDGTLNLQVWTAGIPDDYPLKPPKVRFPANFYHPNVYPSGTICLSILNEDQDWKPAITLKQIVLGVQDLLDSPNPDSPAQEPAWRAFGKDRATYDRKVKEQAQKYLK